MIRNSGMKRLAIKRVFLAALLCAALPHPDTASLRSFAQQAERTTAASQQQATPSEAEKRRESFEIVWSTVKESFYDPTFGGVDWDKVYERYSPRVIKAGSDEEFHLLLQEMLNELRQSHFLIIPSESIPKVLAAKGSDDSSIEDVDDEMAAEDLLNNANYRMAERLTHGIGIDLRIVDGTALVTRVEPGSSAAQAGLRPGFVIKEVDGESLDVIIKQVTTHPVWQNMIGPEMPLVLLAGYINGAAQTTVELVYLDGQNRPGKVSVVREKLKGEMSPAVGNIPSVFTEFESKRLAGGIGYIRFNFFMPPVMEKLCVALRSMREAPGIIIDLRGNHGGLLAMIGGLSGLLETEAVTLGTLETRTGQNAFYVSPQKVPYTGPLAILIDGSTQSSGEIFAGGMQETGRAKIIGERSAGDALPSMIKKLPTGALFQYGFANYRTPKGISLEGRGVVPDIEVKLTRNALLADHDPQLDTAIEQIRQRSAPQQRTLAREASPGNHKGVREEPPTPPQPLSQSVARKEAEKIYADSLPMVNRILKRYVEAMGGSAALEKLTSRVSRGRMEMDAIGLSGVAELYEKAPNKSILIVQMPGLGQMQRGFDGTTAWWQDSLMGYIKLTGNALAKARRETDFFRNIRIKEMYPLWVYGFKMKVGERDAHVLWAGFPGTEFDKLYFDVQTGLLLRKGNIYYEDYREVDGVKWPFTIREESPLGFAFTFRTDEVKHNVVIDDAKFVEYPNCFTRPEKIE